MDEQEFIKERFKSAVSSAVKAISEKDWILISKTDIRNELFQFSMQNNLGILTLQKEERSLEDAFKALTKK